jgi:hypothetical protein
MNRYNAEQERAAGRRTLDDTERLLDFGPRRDHTALTRAVSNILRLKISNSRGEPERVFRRTKTGKHFWVDPDIAEVIGIETESSRRLWAAPASTEEAEANATERFKQRGLPRREGFDLATVHDTVDGIIRYVGMRAAFPERIVDQLRQTAVLSTELAIPPRQIIGLEQRPVAPVIPLHEFVELPDYVPEPLPAVASVAL